MKSLSLRAYAKVNLSLNVTGKRFDGYHNLESIMQGIGLFDILTVEKISINPKSPRVLISVSGDDAIPVNSENLAHRAATLALTSFDIPKEIGLSVTIDKKIPSAAGLAGGSSDAAATLLATAILFERNETLEELCAMGAKIGADVPFCVSLNAHEMATTNELDLRNASCTCLTEGIGDILTPLHSPGGSILLVKPPLALSTPEVYRQFDLGDHIGLVSDTEALRKALANKGNPNLDLLTANMKNALQEPAISLCPEIREILENLRKTIPSDSIQMSGSGPTIFVYFSNSNLQKRAMSIEASGLEEALKERDCFVCFVQVLE